jgi:hypothetical protein
MPIHQLTVRVAPAGANSVTVSLTTQNLDRIDPFVNQRPQQSVDLSSSTTALVIAKPSAASAELRLEGYSGGKLAANRVLRI